MTENSYEQLEDLLVEIRLSLLEVRKSDPVNADRLKGLVLQLELWVESLVIDSLKLRDFESWLQRTAQLAQRLRKRLDGRPGDVSNSTVTNPARLSGKDISPPASNK